MARDDDHHLDDLSEELPPREVTLSTSTILGLFFALALVCAAFFGFGYSVGRKSSALPAGTDPNAPVADTYKPAAGSPAIQPVPGYLTSQQAADANKSADDNRVYAAPSASTPGKPDPSASTKPPAAAQEALASATPAAQQPPPVEAKVSAAPAAGNSYVQIAAVSRQDDADLLLKALRSRGYAVSAQTGADHLIHVQMGPFVARKDADTMRQRLLADGYNAIIK